MGIKYGILVARDRKLSRSCFLFVPATLVLIFLSARSSWETLTLVSIKEGNWQAEPYPEAGKIKEVTKILGFEAFLLQIEDPQPV